MVRSEPAARGQGGYVSYVDVHGGIFGSDEEENGGFANTVA